MALEVTPILLNAQSADKDVRKFAEDNLKQFEEQNLPLFLVSLSIELANSAKPAESRRLAGLILKNSLDAKDAQRKHELAQKWQAAFECLVSIASTYYEKLQPYMQNIFTVTSKAVKEDKEPVALQAIEFWSAICDEEIEIQEEITSGYSGDSEVPYFQFIKKALTYLVPLLLETMTKQEEDQDVDEDVWNLSMAGGTCLGLVARTVEDDIVPLVMPFIQDNIVKPDWRCREAATYAFGSILEGPSLEKLAPLVNAALGFLLNALKDENSSVKDTTAWTLGRIFEFLHGPGVDKSVITTESLPHILSCLLESLKDTPNVAERTCGALYFLAQGYEEMRGQPSPLSPFYQQIVEGLIHTADREDASDSRLRFSAYETLNEVVRCSTEETATIVMQLMPIIMQKLDSTFQMQVVSSDDREKQGEVQALLCGVLQVIIQKLSAAESTKVTVIQFADQIMGLFLKVFACRSATVHEEAMLAIGAVAYATGSQFEKYMSEFYRYLEMGLQNYEEYQVCAITVGVVGDICRALEEKVLPYCDGIMTQLLKDLSSNQLHRSVKPPIFSCFGDIALAIGEHFEKYLMYALPMLQGAAEVTAQQALQDPEMIDYNNQLRTGILEAYSGILQGFKATKPDLMLQSGTHVLQFIETIYRDEDRDEVVSKAAVGVLGDLADTLGTPAAGMFRQITFYKDFLDMVQMMDDAPLKETAAWAMATINRILST
ncbi:importin subunit beta-1 [Selaginella moellendorffii]|uniref:importin subunit beta-1 n=1 Tax=Selaginella moellendorffii TaxID=88036 RepID=UPI000D1C3F83|nr:importin subunit beta-1 [Selaginella moellendorffii]|eukprot:XP_002994383.2 importin subunit beta-1 [Selaginella moellendorffii]